MSTLSQPAFVPRVTFNLTGTEHAAAPEVALPTVLKKKRVRPSIEDEIQLTQMVRSATASISECFLRRPDDDLSAVKASISISSELRTD